jgi:hypothetical protein
MSFTTKFIQFSSDTENSVDLYMLTDMLLNDDDNDREVTSGKTQQTNGFWLRSAQKDTNNILKNVQLFFSTEL